MPERTCNRNRNRTPMKQVMCICGVKTIFTLSTILGQAAELGGKRLNLM